MPNQSLFVFTEGLQRAKLAEFIQLTPYMRANADPVPDKEPEQSPVPEIEALQRNVLTLFQQIVAGSPPLSAQSHTLPPPTPTPPPPPAPPSPPLPLLS